jgi:excisionase family DNA binding protein
MPTEHFPTARLLLTVRQAAKALAVSERTLWALTAPRGPIRSVRFGRSVRYSVDSLRDWIESQSEGAHS